MDLIHTKKLKQASQKLWDLLLKYRDQEAEADLCFKALEPLLKEAAQEKMVQPLFDIPCGYYFHEGSLRKYPDLEEAYSNFAVLARGQDSQAIQQFVDSL